MLNMEEILEEEMPEEEKEIPSYLLSKLITWLRNKGHNDSEVLDCIEYICNSNSEK